MVNGCIECGRLWSEYTQATHLHFALDNKLQLAGASHDHDAVQALTSGVTKASENRVALRAQFAAHDLSAHTEPDSP